MEGERERGRVAGVMGDVDIVMLFTLALNSSRPCGNTHLKLGLWVAVEHLAFPVDR